VRCRFLVFATSRQTACKIALRQISVCRAIPDTNSPIPHIIVARFPHISQFIASGMTIAPKIDVSNEFLPAQSLHEDQSGTPKIGF
jgi:hypothetical protein